MVSAAYMLPEVHWLHIQQDGEKRGKKRIRKFYITGLRAVAYVRVFGVDMLAYCNHDERPAYGWTEKITDII